MQRLRSAAHPHPRAWRARRRTLRILQAPQSALPLLPLAFRSFS
jgi:hypothetical protein